VAGLARAGADPATLSQLRLDVIKDHFLDQAVKGGRRRSRAMAQSAEGRKRPTVLIWRLVHRLLSAMQAVKRARTWCSSSRGRPTTREHRLATRQGMLDALALLDPSSPTNLEDGDTLRDEAVRLLSLPKTRRPTSRRCSRTTSPGRMRRRHRRAAPR